MKTSQLPVSLSNKDVKLTLINRWSFVKIDHRLYTLWGIEKRGSNLFATTFANIDQFW